MVDGASFPIETIKTFWNRQEIRWEQVDGVWQYTFGGRPGGQDWPEKGAGAEGADDRGGEPSLRLRAVGRRVVRALAAAARSSSGPA